MIKRADVLFSLITTLFLIRIAGVTGLVNLSEDMKQIMDLLSVVLGIALFIDICLNIRRR